MVPPELLIIYTLISQTWEKTNRRNQSRQRIIKTQRFIDVLVKLKYNSRVLGVLFHLPKLLLHVGRFTKRGKKYQSDVRSILMPRTFHIAHLNRHTRKISGVPLKTARCKGFGVRSLPTSINPDSCAQKKAILRCSFGRNKFSWLNGQFLPTACSDLLKDNVVRVHLRCLGTIYVNPVARQIFCIIVVRNSRY